MSGRTAKTEGNLGVMWKPTTLEAYLKNKTYTKEI